MIDLTNENLNKITENLDYKDLQDAMDLDISAASIKDLEAAKMEIVRFSSAMNLKVAAIEKLQKVRLPQEYQQGTLLDYVSSDGAYKEQVLVEKTIVRTVNSKAFKKAAGIEISVTNVADPKLASYISNRQVLNMQDVISDYIKGDTSLNPFVNETIEEQAVLFGIVEAKEGGESNE